MGELLLASTQHDGDAYFEAEKVYEYEYDMVGGDMARVTSLDNGPMDSVQVGKAVFVKEKLHNPGNRTQDLLLSGENWLP